MDASLYTKFPHTMLYTQHMVFPINKDINSESRGQKKPKRAYILICEIMQDACL